MTLKTPTGTFPEWVTDAIRDLPPLSPIREAARFLGVSARTLSRCVARGELHVVRLAETGSSRALVARGELARFLTERAK